LRRTRIAPVAVGRRLAPAVLASLGVAAVSVVAAQFISADLIAVLVAGLAAGAALALLLYSMRGAVRALRSVGSPEPEPEAAAAASVT